MDDIESRVHGVIITQLGCDPDAVSDDKRLMDDLGGDSLDVVELIMALETEFLIEIDDDSEAPGIRTVGDCVTIVRNKTLAQAA
jgi:acyl carrier protein